MKILYITLLSIILLTTYQAKSQVRSSLPDTETKIVKFYPNPAISYITFEIEKDPGKSYTLQIYNFMGGKVKEIPDISSKTIVNVSDFTRGLYIFQLKDHTGHVEESGRFQVNK
jgi:hypothetical protein